jgi:hypothetical protein
MLGKDTGIPRIHRLRVIHLYECDPNLLFLLFFRELNQHCEDNFLINKVVYGCRPNRRAIYPVFVDVTQTEMAMVTRKQIVKFSNDATTCFDRILVHLLNLYLRLFRMPKKLTTILGELLKVARYAIKKRNRDITRDIPSLREITGIWIRTRKCSISTRLGENRICTI